MNKSSLIHFIINPHAGTNKIVNKLAELPKNLLSSERFNVQVHITKSLADFYRLMHSIAQDKDAIVVAVGGDGTVNTLINAVADLSIPIAIVPMGSGNGLARELQIPLKPKQAIEMLNRAKIKTIDVLKINDRYAGNVAGIGFDAHISQRFASLEKRGLLAYIRLVYKELKHYRSQSYTLTVDGEVVTKDAFMISFSNSRQFGNNAYIAPLAQPDDGFLDVTVVSPLRWYAMPRLLVDLFTKRFHKNKRVETFRAKQVEITGHSTLDLHLDGEPVSFSTPVTIEIIPKKMSILVPEK